MVWFALQLLEIYPSWKVELELIEKDDRITVLLILYKNVSFRSHISSKLYWQKKNSEKKTKIFKMMKSSFISFKITWDQSKLENWTWNHYKVEGITYNSNNLICVYNLISFYIIISSSEMEMKKTLLKNKNDEISKKIENTN